MAGWTTPRTFVAGEVETAAIFNAHLRDNLNALNGYKIKSADQTVTSSTVLTNDLHLAYTIPAAGSYVFDLWLYVVSAADNAGDFKFGFTFPTGTCHFGQIAPAVASLGTGATASADWVGALSAVSGTTTIAMGASLFGIFAHVHGDLIATASGTLQFQWAQFASSASGTTLKAGSHMRVQQAA